MTTPCETTDLLVFSHLRWDFVFQRPQHLLSRHAKHRRVFYFEEPIWGMTELPRLHLKETSENVLVVIPYLPTNLNPVKLEAVMTDLVDELVYEEELIDFSIWYYTPMALPFSRHLKPRNILFDCIDELSLLNDAPKILVDMEAELMARADLVFTDGQSLYEAKKKLHHNIHSAPSSIDFNHFSQARQKLIEPDDQVNIPRPRVGFSGVVDERMDLNLLKKIAELRSDYHFVVIGPVLKIDEMTLPRKPNIHYLGKKDYHALPLYLSGWDCAIMPFALNESTKYISPAKTPEFLAAARPVVSTSINEVVNPYARQRLVYIADSPIDFVESIDIALEEKKLPEWIDRVDHYLRDHSWDKTFNKMAALEKAIEKNNQKDHPRIIYPLTLNASGVI